LCRGAVELLSGNADLDSDLRESRTKAIDLRQIDACYGQGV
jgi:hypothetical protein